MLLLTSPEAKRNKIFKHPSRKLIPKVWLRRSESSAAQHLQQIREALRQQLLRRFLRIQALVPKKGLSGFSCHNRDDHHTALSVLLFSVPARSLNFIPKVADPRKRIFGPEPNTVRGPPDPSTLNPSPHFSKPGPHPYEILWQQKYPCLRNLL